MATSMSPGDHKQLRKAHKKIADLKDDVRRLSKELRRKEDLLQQSLDVAHEQCLRMSSLSAALQDTVPWDPTGPRPSVCSAPASSDHGLGLPMADRGPHLELSRLQSHSPITMRLCRSLLAPRVMVGVRARLLRPARRPQPPSLGAHHHPGPRVPRHRGEARQLPCTTRSVQPPPRCLLEVPTAALLLPVLSPR